jgi:hypothetical protein
MPHYAAVGGIEHRRRGGLLSEGMAKPRSQRATPFEIIKMSLRL